MGGGGLRSYATEYQASPLTTTAVIDLKKAELYETANEVYKLMIPRLENIRDYARLADVGIGVIRCDGCQAGVICLVA